MRTRRGNRRLVVRGAHRGVVYTWSSAQPKNMASRLNVVLGALALGGKNLAKDEAVR